MSGSWTDRAKDYLKGTPRQDDSIPAPNPSPATDDPQPSSPGDQPLTPGGPQQPGEPGGVRPGRPDRQLDPDSGADQLRCAHPRP